MSSCISVKIRRVGAITASATREPDAVIGVSCTAVGGISARVSHVCTPNIRHPYLEISPEIIWVYPDWSAYNEVYSNTNWTVN